MPLNPRKILVGKVFPALMVIVFLAAAPAHAYLDGGNGAMLLQTLLAGVGGLLVMLRFFFKRLWHRVKPEKKH